MGEAEFKLRPLLKRHNVHVFSSNFSLYSELSQRVMATVESLAGEVEQYSIDECFVTLTPALAPNAMEVARSIVDRVQQWLGLPVSVGIGASRTLSKLACHLAKQYGSKVFFLNGTEDDHDRLFAQIPVGEVWGIGRRMEKRLLEADIRTVKDLKYADTSWIRKNLSVNGLHTVLELRGIPCISEISIPTEKRKTIVCLRSFGEKIRDKASMAHAVTTFVSRAAARMRKYKLATSGLAFFIATSRFSDQYEDKSWQTTFSRPTIDTALMIKEALKGLDSIFKPGLPYARAGVLLFELSSNKVHQGNLLDLSELDRDLKREALMHSIDAINTRYGQGKVRFALEGDFQEPWHMKQERRSPAYLTDWEEIPTALCENKLS